MLGWSSLLVLLAPMGFLAHRAYRRPRGVYLRSVAAVALVVLGWAAIWLLSSPSNEAGFGFFVVWVALTVLALLAGLAAAAGATARYVADTLGVAHK
jgi:hypothetical protein